MRKQAADVELAIPKDKADTIKRARKMQAGGWKALKDMGDAELEAWAAELEGAYVHQPGKHGSAARNMPVHPHNQTRLDALSAVTNERGRRRREQMARNRDLLYREQCISKAAEALHEAARLVEAAAKIAPGWPNEVPAPPSLDVAAASDGELERTATDCRFIIGGTAHYEKLLEQAEAIEQLDGAAAKGIHSELQERAEKQGARIEGARKLLEAISAEQGKRERDRLETAERRAPEVMEQRISELEKMLAGRTEAAGR